MATPTKRAPTPTMNATRKATKAEQENNLARALAGLADGTYKSFKEASRETGASRKTVARRFNGGNSRREAHARFQSLSPDDESALVKWVERLSCTGLPVHHQFLHELAEELLFSRLASEGSATRRLGKHWVSRFLARNPSLQSKVAKSIEKSRADVTEEQLWNWFTTFERVMIDYAIDLKDIYNMDETGYHHANVTDCRI